MGKFDLEDSWLDEFYKIAEEKGLDKEIILGEGEVEIPEIKLGPGEVEYPSKIDIKLGPEEVEHINKLVKKEQVDRFGVDSKFVANLQAFLMNKTGMNVSNPRGKFLGSPDGMWGLKSAAAWNAYAEKINGGSAGSVPQVVEHIKEDGSEFPKMDNIRYIFDKNTDRKANVMNELISLANDLDNLGNKEAADIVDKHMKVYAEKLYDITSETGEDFINKAHPGGGKVLFQAADEGGKIETVIEENKKIMDKIKKVPTGKLAQMVNKLIATANKLEDEGNVKAAKIIDKTIAELLPFEKRRTEIEASGSENYNASIVKNANTEELKIFIPVWDNFVKKFYIIADELSGWSSEGFEFLNPSSKKVRNFYTLAKNKVYEIGENWKLGNLNKELLINEIKELIKILNIEDVSDGIRNMVFNPFGVNAKRIQKITQIHYQLISDLKRLILLIRNSKKSKSNKEKEKTKEKKPLTMDEMYKGIKQKRVIEYVKVLDEFAKFVYQNDGTIKEKLGEEKFKELVKWLKNQKYNVKSDTKYQFHEDLTDKSVNNLKKYMDSLKSFVSKSASVKFAEDIPKIEFGKSKPSVSTDKKPSGKPKRKKDNDVKILQEGMKEFLNIPLVPDGDWGQKTLDAWNKVRKAIPAARLSIGTSTSNYQNLKSEFPRAMRFMAYMLQKRQETEKNFQIDGKEYVLSDFANVRNFVAAINRNYNLSEMTHDAELKKEIWSHIKIVWNKLFGEDGENIKLFYGPQFFNQIKSKIINIAKDLIKYGIEYKKEEPGLPKYPDEKAKEGKPLAEMDKLPGITRPGKKDAPGIIGLKYPELNSAKNVLNAINLLPDDRFLSSKENFRLKTNGVMKSKYAPKQQPDSELGKIQYYYRMLYSRVSNIVNALEEYGPEIRARSSSLYEDAMSAITRYNNNLQWVRRQFGF